MSTLTTVEDARCPACGLPVYMPLPAWRSYVPHAKDTDTVVICSDMGHWIGTLQECKDAKEKP